MNLQQLIYFRKIAELQHYTKAASTLFITQPALSKAIHNLEVELGVTLFQKEGRNVTLTPSGGISSSSRHFFPTTPSFCRRRSHSSAR